eukprot:TRINITY_DN1977_c0_g1_i2.p1 TRINITY_DN1977_c0_g1~~TRINITY_DN1977_c0_g1_i2.p1  ORF type:complete len:372 (+),score=134.41 TRINITY_DN1977_c0_g1_i2:61-1176(+)
MNSQEQSLGSDPKQESSEGENKTPSASTENREGREETKSTGPSTVSNQQGENKNTSTRRYYDSDDSDSDSESSPDPVIRGLRVQIFSTTKELVQAGLREYEVKNTIGQFLDLVIQQLGGNRAEAVFWIQLQAPLSSKFTTTHSTFHLINDETLSFEALGIRDGQTIVVEVRKNGKSPFTDVTARPSPNRSFNSHYDSDDSDEGEEDDFIEKMRRMGIYSGGGYPSAMGMAMGMGMRGMGAGTMGGIPGFMNPYSMGGMPRMKSVAEREEEDLEMAVKMSLEEEVKRLEKIKKEEEEKEKQKQQQEQLNAQQDDIQKFYTEMNIRNSTNVKVDAADLDDDLEVENDEFDEEFDEDEEDFIEEGEEGEEDADE